MPNPSKFKSQKEFIPVCIATVMKEGGHTKKSAAGKCFGIWRQYLKNKRSKGELSKEEELELQEIEKEEFQKEEKLGEILNKI